MHPLLREYVHRFVQTSVPTSKSFFTQLSKEAYLADLPYIFDLEIFCLRLSLALLKKQKICIYSDYDTDAVTATSVMYHGLLLAGFDPGDLSFYAPDRFVEGYGMNPEAVAMLAKSCDLLISVDCGINSTLEADLVAKSSAELIITDHHQLTGEIPKALGVINPRLQSVHTDKQTHLKRQQSAALVTLLAAELALVSELPAQDWELKILNWLDRVGSSDSPMLSTSVTGVGVAWFCLVWLGYFWRDCLVDGCPVFAGNLPAGLNSLVPLVAIGTVADCQSILEPTNRLLVKVGLDLMQKKVFGCPGLKELFVQTGLAEKLDQGYTLSSLDLGYVLSPILNSSGRLSHANLSISVLLGGVLAFGQESAEFAGSDLKSLTANLIQTNTERKQMVRDITREIETIAAKQVDMGHELLWLQGDWGKGLVGLLASRLVTTFDLPVVVVSMEGEYASGSMRAPEGFDLPKALSACSQYIIKGGGHPQAAGFSADPTNLQPLRQALEEVLGYQNQAAQVSQVYVPSQSQALIPEAVMQKWGGRKESIWLQTADLLTEELLIQVRLLEPFGQDFPCPEFVLPVLGGSFRWLGLQKQHLKIRLPTGITVTCFHLEDPQKTRLDQLGQPASQDWYDFPHSLGEPAVLWLKARPSQNTWQGRTTTELIAQELWFT